MPALTRWLMSPRNVCLGVVLALILTVTLLYKQSGVVLPQVTFGYASQPPVDKSKVALLVEDRPQPLLAPTLLHFIYALPPDWHFRFMGSQASVAHVNKSAAIREQVRAGKLDLTYIPSNLSTAGQEMISRFLTTLWLYETVLQPAEMLLVFQSDSMVCANSKHNMDEYIQYDWVGAPWNPAGRWGGNGGLSIRRVSRIIDILRNQKRIENSEPEDVWLSERLGHHPQGRVASGPVSLAFSGELNSGEPEQVLGPSGSQHDNKSHSLPKVGRPSEYIKGIDDWRDGHYEPMGYHIGGANYLSGSIWGTPEKREHIWKYCPEVKMIVQTDMADYVPGNCHSEW
ncbi:hypothetical protein HRG_009674 [Hirsutella rhossiliensis]|uniref:DUF5672 domain-containing protein n=1 Tax=Hirsutella rhossiliensis TaxID=111463 RepID=A0A9P8MPA8_9HYPO|nr:uncharacterized protein HRG_09674 [Hirsutella rhossiliensis]KAH0959213.1 hypothetical protein HRG_09674 [Hirsutella rhossiliensis]